MKPKQSAFKPVSYVPTVPLILNPSVVNVPEPVKDYPITTSPPSPESMDIGEVRVDMYVYYTLYVNHLCSGTIASPVQIYVHNYMFNWSI